MAGGGRGPTFRGDRVLEFAKESKSFPRSPTLPYESLRSALLSGRLQSVCRAAAADGLGTMSKQTNDGAAAEEGARKNLENFHKSAHATALLMETFDKDGDRKLDFREFAALVREREMGIHTEEAMRKRFLSLDQNGNGEIEYYEFLIFVLNDTCRRSAARVKDLIAAWDQDKSGLMERDEFRTFVRHLGFQARDDEIDMVFDAWDFDRSGSLNNRELEQKLMAFTREEAAHGDKDYGVLQEHRLRDVGLDREDAQAKVKRTMAANRVDASDAKGAMDVVRKLRTALNGERGVVRILDVIRAWDTDGDSLVTNAEFRQALKSLGFVIAKKEVDELFTILDKDGSGAIEFAELGRLLKHKEEHNASSVHRTPHAPTAPTTPKQPDARQGGAINIEELMSPRRAGTPRARQRTLVTAPAPKEYSHLSGLARPRTAPMRTTSSAPAGAPPAGAPSASARVRSAPISANPYAPSPIHIPLSPRPVSALPLGQRRPAHPTGNTLEWFESVRDSAPPSPRMLASPRQLGRDAQGDARALERAPGHAPLSNGSSTAPPAAPFAPAAVAPAASAPAQSDRGATPNHDDSLAAERTQLVS